MVTENDERERTRRIALEFLGVRDRSVREMRERLQKRGCPASAIDTVVSDLEALRLLDDRTFVRRWVESRRQRRPEGVPKIVQDLVKRRVERAVVDEVLAEFDGELGSPDEALELLRRQRGGHLGLEATAAQRRMFGLLARRGFDSDTARDAVERAWREFETETHEL